MAVTQVGNGWINTERNTYTTYDSKTGQLITQALPRGFLNDPALITALQNGSANIADYIQKTDANYLGGRSNVNLNSSVEAAIVGIMADYPQMTKARARQYALDWITNRIAAGHDANQIEDMAKGVTREDNFNDLDGQKSTYSVSEMRNGIKNDIAKDEQDDTPDDATGASIAAANDPNAGKGSIQDELRAFAGRMMSVLPPDSPQVQRIAELAAAAGNKYATASGLGPGGITTTGVANTAVRANVDLQTQREGIGAQALAAAGNQQLSVDQMNTQLQQMNQQAANSQAGGVGGLIGGAAGLIGGGIATAYGANPSIIPGLMQAGSAAGSGIATWGSNNAQGPIQYGGGQQPQSTYKGRSWGTS